MNVKFFAASMMITGMVSGITVSHYHQVNHLVKHGVPSIVPSGNHPELKSPAAPSPEAELPGKPALAKAGLSQQPLSSQALVKGSARDDALLEILAAIRNEQQSIRKQISESNRDIDELTFRVDTHSDSFKPLQTEVERPRSLDIIPDPSGADEVGLLPPKQ